MKRAATILVMILEGLLVSANARAQQPPLLPEKTVSALAQELSGETAKRNLEFLARLHRQRGSRDFHTAAEFMVARARDYGLTDAHIEEFPADGKIFYGTQRSRPAWDADFADLWELRQKEEQWIPVERLGDFQAMPVTLAEDSESADVTAELIDVGSGTSEQDYAGKDVSGKIVLVSAQPGGEVEGLAIEKFGAAGIVSYAQNQPNAWQGEDDNLVRWGHLDSFPKTPTFAFMISLRTARALRDRLARGESIRLHAVVKAGRHSGFYDIATAVIPGADTKLRSQEIVFSCHLDHERPGANDNASGCVTILEVARTLQKLIAEDRIPRPARTIRFVWPAEVEGTLALLNGKPELVPYILAVVHMDMVGGGEVTKSIFHVTRAPMSLPTFLNDVAEAFGEFVNEQSYEFAATGRAAYPLVAPEGSKQALLAQFSEFTPGSDHDVYECGSYRIPAIYLNDWPDRYIHTNFDAAANIDPTKLLRAAFIGGASGYFLANLGEADSELLRSQMMIGKLEWNATMLRHSNDLVPGKNPDEESVAARFTLEYPAEVSHSVQSFIPGFQDALPQQSSRMLDLLLSKRAPSPDGSVIFTRAAEPKGPLSVFGYDYFVDHYGSDRARSLKIFHYEGLRGGGEDYAYEVLNFADGKRNAQEIRDAVSAEYGPLPFSDVIEYLRGLESIGILQVKK